VVSCTLGMCKPRYHKDGKGMDGEQEQRTTDKRGTNILIISERNQCLSEDSPNAMELGTDYPSPNQRING
jgi:hypothetical protein